MVYVNQSKQTMIVQRSALDNILMSNVCDIRFNRKIVVKGKPPTRRMWCTKSYDLLNSTNGRVALNYRPPTHPKKVNESINNVLVVWDILMQDYRTISFEQCDVIQQIPANEEFWKFFNDQIYIMGAEQKLQFMNS